MLEQAKNAPAIVKKNIGKRCRIDNINVTVAIVIANGQQPLTIKPRTSCTIGIPCKADVTTTRNICESATAVIFKKL